MRTLIFESYEAFQQRPDKEVNGVSPDFANTHAAWNADRGNKGCYNCVGCYHCVDCVNCTNCSVCARCENCVGCTGCLACTNDTDMFYAASDAVVASGIVPVVESIHQKVWERVQAPNALDMSNWHTCDTQHCRAGWVVTLTGVKGRELEELLDPEAAAMLIYKASSPITVHADEFYDEEEDAMHSMRCAAEQERVLERQARDGTLPNEPAA